MSMQFRGPSLNQIRWSSGLALFLSVGLSLAQSPLNVSVDELEREGRKHTDTIKKLRTGEITPSASDKNVMDAIDYQARLHTYRFANAIYHKVPAIDANKSIEYLYKDFDGLVGGLISGKDKDKTKEYARLYALKVKDHSKKVLDEPNLTNAPLVQVNIARVLARTAVLGQPETADAFVEILNGNLNEGVKYWALHGLRDLLSKSNNPTQFLTPAREEKVAQALMTFIKRKVNVSAITPPDELEGLRVIRREAVRALSLLRNPGKSGKDRPAIVLLEVLSGEGLEPPPRIDERMEAAIGLARMRPQGTDYQPAYAAQQIALLLKDFAEYHSLKYKEEKRPTRVLSAQLQDALEALRTETKDPYVEALFGPGKPGTRLLEKITLDQSADPAEVVTYAETNKPMTESIFKNMPEATAPPQKK